MEARYKYLSELQSYIDETDKEVTMILQSLQWDRKHLLEGVSLVSCNYESSHKMPPEKKILHEEQCFLKSQGYTDEDKLLPDPPDPDVPTLLKLSNKDIKQIINNAALADPAFKRGSGCDGCEPLTAERMLVVYTKDERRAIHDAVTSNTLLNSDFSQDKDLTLLSLSGESQERRKTKLEVLAELRNMRRRRTKYRGAAAASRNYSHILRDLITTQMEMYTGTQTVEVSHTSHVLECNDNRRTHKSIDSLSLKSEEYKMIRNDYKVERNRERSNSVDKQTRRDYQGKYRDKSNDRHSSSRTRYDEHRNKKHESKYNLKEDGQRSRERRREFSEWERSDRYVESSTRRRDSHESRRERSHRQDEFKESSPRSRKRHRTDRNDAAHHDSHSMKHKRY